MIPTLNTLTRIRSARAGRTTASRCVLLLAATALLGGLAPPARAEAPAQVIAVPPFGVLTALAGACWQDTGARDDLLCVVHDTARERLDVRSFRHGRPTGWAILMMSIDGRSVQMLSSQFGTGFWALSFKATSATTAHWGSPAESPRQMQNNACKASWWSALRKVDADSFELHEHVWDQCSGSYADALGRNDTRRTFVRSALRPGADGLLKQP